MRIRSSRPAREAQAPPVEAPTSKKPTGAAWWRFQSSKASAATAPADALPESDAPTPTAVTGASELLVSLARRNQALLYRQLARLDEMEARDLDAATLADLFVVDHLATRMRRNAESLLILSGEESARRMSRPVPFSEAIRGAMAEIEDYNRVDVTVQGEAELSGRAVADVVHLLAELVENAASFSPPDSRVALHGARTRDGYAVTITDRGVGLEPEQVEFYNTRLASYSDADDLEASSMLGFRVVRRLAARHDVAVRLVSQVGHGTMVTVEVPASLLIGVEPVRAPVEVPVVAEAPVVHHEAPEAAAPAFAIGMPRQYFPDGIVPPGYAPSPPAPPVVPVPVAAEYAAPEYAIPEYAAPEYAAPEYAAHAPAAPAYDPPAHDAPESFEPTYAPSYSPAPEQVPAPTASYAPAPEPAHQPVSDAGYGYAPADLGLDPGLEFGLDAGPYASIGSDLNSPLTRRVPQGNLAPQMRGLPVTPTLPSSSAAVPEPERARSLLSSYSNGLTLGRAAIPDHPGDAGSVGDEELR